LPKETKKFDLDFRSRHNLTEDEFEYYIERMGFRVEGEGQDEEEAAFTTLKEIQDKRKHWRKG